MEFFAKREARWGFFSAPPTGWPREDRRDPGSALEWRAFERARRDHDPPSRRGEAGFAVLRRLAPRGVQAHEDFPMVEGDHVRGGRIAKKISVDLGDGLVRNEGEFDLLQRVKRCVGFARRREAMGQGGSGLLFPGRQQGWRGGGMVQVQLKSGNGHANSNGRRKRR